MKKILVTGAAGFIGFHYTQRLCEQGYEVLGIDNLNDYYDPALKQARLDQLEALENFSFRKIDLADSKSIEEVFLSFKPEMVAHLGAQAGVRYSLENPQAYIDSNIVGLTNILEGCRHNDVKHLVFASSSSVYGANKKVPFSTEDNVDHPVSLYAATKKAGELMVYSYAHLYGTPSTALRFFTVYGPWGRPDMAYFKFVKAIYEGKAIDVYNNGDMKRDFTYIDDITEALMRLVDKTPAADENGAPYKLYNIGNNSPEDLMVLISMIEEEVGVEAEKNMLPMQPGDVYETYADTDDLERDIGFKPSTPLKKGLQEFVKWYRDYYNMGNKPVLKQAGNE
ncbi:MAG: NAD-dependent epimerase [Micavibrio sp.]|nr:MAG: NAD-dependent epimerase [Micavibrio sp.]